MQEHLAISSHGFLHQYSDQNLDSYSLDTPATMRNQFYYRKNNIAKRQQAEQNNDNGTEQKPVISEKSLYSRHYLVFSSGSNNTESLVNTCV